MASLLKTVILPEAEVGDQLGQLRAAQGYGRQVLAASDMQQLEVGGHQEQLGQLLAVVQVL